MGKSSINGPFSMAMLNNQRVVYICTYQKLSSYSYSLSGNIIKPHIYHQIMSRSISIIDIIISLFTYHEIVTFFRPSDGAGPNKSPFSPWCWSSCCPPRRWKHVSVHRPNLRDGQHPPDLVSCWRWFIGNKNAGNTRKKTQNSLGSDIYIYMIYWLHN